MCMDKLTTNRSYDCYCGIKTAFEFAAAYILEHTTVSDVSKLKIAVVSDRIVSGYYYNQFENQFILRGLKPVLIPIEATDNGKGISAVDQIYKYFTDFDFGFNDWVIALGGGGIIDVTGFACGVFNGGISLMAVPTTLNAMADISVSNSSKLNSGSHKDQMSVPFNPDVVICDPSFLETCNNRIKANGYASIIRYAILDDISILMDLEKPGNMREYLNRVYASRSRIESINPDLLSVGSEIAGAIEGYFRFMNYSEGEALALSLLCSVDERRRLPLTKIYEALGLPTKLKDVSGKMILKTLNDRFDRLTSGQIRFVDFDEANGGKWVVKTLPVAQAKEIFAKRLSLISDID